MDEGNLDEALHLCDQLLADDPQDLEVRIIKSRLLSVPQPGLHDRDGAVQVLIEALEWHSASAELHEALGDAYAEACGDYSEALAPQNCRIEEAASVAGPSPGARGV